MISERFVVDDEGVGLDFRRPRPGDERWIERAVLDRERKVAKVVGEVPGNVIPMALHESDGIRHPVVHPIPVQPEGNTVVEGSQPVGPRLLDELEQEARS